jgi:hypothetical protein
MMATTAQFAPSSVKIGRLPACLLQTLQAAFLKPLFVSA